MRIARESLLLLGFLAGPMAAGAADDGEFRTRVAPIFEARCVRCHGPEKPKGGLSLATARGLLAGGDGGPAVVPGRPEESLLLEMIAGPAPEMPRGGDPLPAEAVATIRHWIEQGAPWPEGLVLKSARSGAGPWWSLTPLARPEIPRVHAADRVRAPIDAFLLKALEAKGLAFGPEADRRTLIRRLSFDLTGLPPTPEEVDGFLHDTAPDAYERLVERLLASPHYGERWARHWLDVVHYGDTHGYDKDKPRRHAWPYRDYVIGAFNADTPYARFIREQIAGDVLFPGEPEATIATGFVAAGPWDFVGQTELREGTVDKAKARLLDRDDMVATTMSTFVSLTVHCARCHDHKFDPIPREDYYRLQAVFAGVDRGDRPWMTRAMMEQRTALDARKRAIAARLVALQRRADAVTSLDLVRLDGELEAMRNRRAALPAPVVDTPSPTNGYHSGISPAPDVTKWVQVDLGAAVPIGAIRLVPARPTDFPDTPGFGFPVRFRVELAEDATFANAAVVADHATADVANPGDEPYVVTPIGHRARFVRITATRLWPRRGDYVFALGELEVLSGGRNVAAGCKVTAPDSIEAGRWSTRALVDGHDSRHRLADRSDPEVAARLLQREALSGRIRAGERRRHELAESLIDPETRSALGVTAAELADVERGIEALPPPSLVYALRSIPPRPIHVLNRGDVEQPGAVAAPGALSCLPGLEFDFRPARPDDEGARRAALAAWVADPRNVLTWRSIVNRVWQYHFGRGLVETPNDFGRNGALPSHPELLDWLAVEFRDGGGSLKALHRLLVRSAAYRQAARDDRAAAAVDAENRLLWRMDRRRLDAESLRDAVLAVSGTLNTPMGGPGVELFRFKDDHSPVYDHEAPEKVDTPEARRRTVYRFVVRSVPNPLLDCLDAADPNASTPVRNTTITALQALALLNDAFIVTQAGHFAERLRSLSDDPRRQIEIACALAFGHPPWPGERDALVEYATRHGLADACRLLFNTNEFAFVD